MGMGRPARWNPSLGAATSLTTFPVFSPHASFFQGPFLQLWLLGSLSPGFLLGWVKASSCCWLLISAEESQHSSLIPAECVPPVLC